MHRTPGLGARKRAIAGHVLTGGPRGWLAARRFCILLIVPILDQVIPVIYIYIEILLR